MCLSSAGWCQEPPAERRSPLAERQQQHRAQGGSRPPKAPRSGRSEAERLDAAEHDATMEPGEPVYERSIQLLEELRSIERRNVPCISPAGARSPERSAVRGSN